MKSNSLKIDSLNPMDLRFYNWLADCPVSWMKVKVDDTHVYYGFLKPNKEIKEEDEEWVLN